MLLAIAVGSTAWLVGGLSGVAYLLAFPMLCLPGFPLGAALFGRRHPAAWLASLLLGYATTTLAVWAMVFTGHSSLLALLAAWAAAIAATTLATFSVRAPLVALPEWTPRTSSALLVLLLVVPLLTAVPFRRLGAVDADGARNYRAYFIADFAWHTALTAELAREDPRPKNPYLADEPLHYYWTYFRVPAAVTANAAIAVEPLLKVNAVITALLLTWSIFVATWMVRPEWPAVSATAVALTILAASAEGLAAIADIVWRGLPLSELRDLNIDAIAAWAFKGLRVDNLPRTMWYTPQHGFACALGLLAITAVLSPTRATASWRTRLLIGCALGGAIAFSPLLGVACCAVYGTGVLLDAARSRQPLSHYLAESATLVPVIAALGWCALVQVGEGAGAVLHIGFWGLARNGTVPGFVLQFGPLLPLIGLGLWSVWHRRRAQAWIPATGVLLAVLVMHLLALTVDLAWAGFRGGNIFFIFAPPLVAAGLLAAAERWSFRFVAAATLALAACGLPTTAIDAFNAQDIANHHLSRDAERVRGREVNFDPAQEFHWTMVVPRASLEALTWIREHTAAAAVVQAEPIVRGRESWSLIPSLGERRMATGIPVPLLDRPIYRERNAQVRDLYATPDAAAAWTTARHLGIGYLYLDRTERLAYPQGTAKFAADRQHFAAVFDNHEATVYAVLP